MIAVDYVCCGFYSPCRGECVTPEAYCTDCGVEVSVNSKGELYTRHSCRAARVVTTQSGNDTTQPTADKREEG